MRRCSPIIGACTATLAALSLLGCGGGKQGADEPEGSFPVEVSAASFPARQHVATPVTMRITVRNAGRRTIPNISVGIFKTGAGSNVGAFSQTSQQVGVASSSRPLWIVQDGPLNGETSYSNTWVLGRLGAGRSRTFQWSVTPISAGSYSLTYRVGAGLYGKARAVAPGGGPVDGRFRVRVDGRPA